MNPTTQVAQGNVVETLSEELVRQLRNVPILSSLKDDELHCLNGVHELRFNAGDTIAKQGGVDHFFWIVLEGELRIHQLQTDGGDVTLSKIESGNTFGELPLLTNVPNAGSVESTTDSRLLQLDEEQFWNLMTSCPQVRKAILSNMSYRFQKMQSIVLQQEKMASLGTLAAGLMHELNNPGAAARRAASQLRENLTRMHELSTHIQGTRPDPGTEVLHV